MALSLTHRPQVMGLACVELEKSFIAETDISCCKSTDHQINSQPARFLVQSFPLNAERAGGLGFVACVLL